MREMKFRAWDKEHNKMWFMGEEGESVGKCTDRGIWTFQSYFNEKNCLEAILIRSFCNGVGYEDEVVKLPIMEYTGMKDKHGREIYEGDIIKYNFKSLLDKEGINRDRIAPVYWQEFRGCWAVKEGKNCNSDLFQYVQNGNVVEVIGNIYENHKILN